MTFNRLVTPCKVIRIPESWNFLPLESGILGIRIQSAAFGIQNPAEEWIQNPFAENPFQIIITAFTRIHATTVMLKHRVQTVQTTPTMQTALISLENFDCYSSRYTDKFIHDLSPSLLRHCHCQFPTSYESVLYFVNTAYLWISVTVLTNEICNTFCRVGLISMCSKNLSLRFCFAE